MQVFNHNERLVFYHAHMLCCVANASSQLHELTICQNHFENLFRLFLSYNVGVLNHSLLLLCMEQWWFLSFLVIHGRRQRRMNNHTLKNKLLIYLVGNHSCIMLFFFFALICLDMHEYILAMSILQVLLLGINSSLEMIWWLQVSVDIGWMELITYASFVANWFASTFLFIWIARNTFSCFLYDTHLIFIALVCWIHFSCARKSYIVNVVFWLFSF